MRSLRILAIVLVVVAPLAAQAPSDNASIARVRAGIDKPASKLTLRDRVPDFSVHVEERRPMQDIFDIPPWQLPPIGWQPPAIGFNLLSVASWVAQGVKDAKRGRDERLAREEVQRALDDYCAAQENRATIQTCSTSPAMR